MKFIPYFMMLLFLPVLVTACAGGESAVPEVPEGPALIMFYTDN